MKRFHVHVAVDDLQSNIRFYSSFFGSAPTVVKDDYAKWMIDDPRINFAISKRGRKAGVNHLGIQVESDDELAERRSLAASADAAISDQTNAACCYARSDKHWVTDPQGVPWETYRTMESIETFGEDSRITAGAEAGACCVPVAETTGQAPAPQPGACCR
jgi:hypothetical protein